MFKPWSRPTVTMKKIWVSLWLRVAGTIQWYLRLLGEAAELLEHVRLRTRNWPDVAGLFLDELSNMVGGNVGLNTKFMDKVNKRFADDFQEEYIEDVIEGK